MSGGFFRGTSADQDTRFSNKQAKLLKSQKFAPELENLVDMTKVMMDVMRPWIAKRVTELIGFEDEVLINFIYTLLEEKEVNGKQVQISLTGFMERNTGKFMKELWALLLSAQQNVSGVPQQFLDAKEEETKRKKAETDRIANELRKKKEKEKEKEKQEAEQDKTKMGGDGAAPRDNRTELELNIKNDTQRSSIEPVDEEERYKRNGRRRHDRDSQSPDSSHHSPSLRQKHSESCSKSSNFRGYSGERQRSISISGDCSPKRSVTPQRRHIFRRSSSPWRRSPDSRRQSASWHRSPSPAQYKVCSPRRHRSRAPLRHRLRSPVRHRSRTPVRRSSARYRSRTPLRRRSPSPVRHRPPSPIQRRSPSPVAHRSPSPKQGRSLSAVRGRSSFFGRRRSPFRHCSPSPLGRRSHSPLQQSAYHARRQYKRSPSTSLQHSASPVHRRSSMHSRKRSFTPDSLRSPQEFSSPSDTCHRYLLPVKRGSAKIASSLAQSHGERARGYDEYSSARHDSPMEKIELSTDNPEGTSFVENRPVVSLRSPQRDMLDQDNLYGKEQVLSSSLRKSPLADASRGRSCSPRIRGRMAHPESSNPLRKAAGYKPYRESSGTSADKKNPCSNRKIGKYNYKSFGKVSPKSFSHKDSLNSLEVCDLIHATKSQKTQLPTSDLIPDNMQYKEHRKREELSTFEATVLSVKGMKSHDDARAKDKKIERVYDTKCGYGLPDMERLHKLSRKSEQTGTFGSPTKESDKYRVKVKEKRKHKKLHRQEFESDDYSSYDSYEERKEAKKRRKEEKKLKKDERRRLREKRRQGKGGRLAEELRLKSGDGGSLSSDLERDHSEAESVRRKKSRTSYTQETDSEQKKLEIALREKALESLRAKKGIGN
ncbi:hypothetical protein OROGR_016694 [Orobanche gracilis]